MQTETFLEHIWVYVNQRRVVIMDNEGYEETVKFRWDEEGAEGFQETIENFKQHVDPDLICYV